MRFQFFFVHFFITLMIFLSFIEKSNSQSPEEVMCYIANNALWEDWNCTVPYCVWRGVFCEDNETSVVVGLNLAIKSLSGTFPTEIGQITNLTILYMFSNAFSGTIPPELGNLTNLESLMLSFNEFTGTIPKEIFYLSNLKTLSLASNYLSGSIPTEIGLLTNMETLMLLDNSLGGVIPTEIGNLTKLQSIRLSDNHISGTIPTEIGYLTSLSILEMYSNSLSGTIPTEIGLMSNLTYAIRLQYNNLSGTIPTEIGKLSNLRYLYAHFNSLSGTIPTEIGSMTNLAVLDLDNNNLSGTIPTEIGLLPLNHISLENNGLTGSIPDEIGNMTNLIYLGLNNNSFTPSISTTTLNWLCDVYMWDIDFITKEDLADYCNGTISAIPLPIVGKIAYDKWDASNFNIILVQNSQVDIGNNFTLNDNSILTIEITSSTASNASLINVGSCIHFGGDLVLKDSLFSDFGELETNYSLIKYQCHEGEFSRVLVDDPSNAICIGGVFYSELLFTVSFTECANDPSDSGRLIVNIIFLVFSIFIVPFLLE